MDTLMHVGVLALTVVVLSRIVPGVYVQSLGTAVLVAVVFSVLNYLFGWVVRGMLFVPAVLTLGVLFLFVPFIVNTVMLWVTDKLIGRFEIRTTGALLVVAAVITLVNSFFYASLAQSAWRGLDGAGRTTTHGAPRWI